jgi:hypothetical protein
MSCLWITTADAVGAFQIFGIGPQGAERLRARLVSYRVSTGRLLRPLTFAQVGRAAFGRAALIAALQWERTSSAVTIS